jgi:mRNA-degrading endonuclease HigB of HigAB toxin-antitoxin module
MRTRIGKRKSNGAEEEDMNAKKAKEELINQPGIVSLTGPCYRNLARYLEDDDLDALSKVCKSIRNKINSDSIWRSRFEYLFTKEENKIQRIPIVLKISSSWKQLYYWQRCSLILQDTSLFGPTSFKIDVPCENYGIRKTVATNSAIFILDNSGTVRKWDIEEEEWSDENHFTPLQNVVDIITDATDIRQHRNSLFVLSQSARLHQERPPLIDFHNWEMKYKGKETALSNQDSKFFDFEKKTLRHWFVTGAAKSGDRVDVFRVEGGNLRRVFKMTFQQAHRFISLQVSNRDYNKTAAQERMSDARGRHINELQLLTTKGRVWSLTVNEPELIANGGGAQVALKNITSRFDFRYSDGNENCQISQIFNGKHVTAMLEKSGDLLLFSDKDDEMTQMFPKKKMIKTTISADARTTRKSAIINIGCAIQNISISRHHMLILDDQGRLWSVGRNRNGQLGLCNQTDQSDPKLVPLPTEVHRVVSISAGSNTSVILCEMKCGRKQSFACGVLRNMKILGYAVDYSEEHVRSHTLASGHANSITKFSPLEVFYKENEESKELGDEFGSVTINNSQIVLTAKQYLRPEGEQDQKTLREKLNSNLKEQCRHCAESETGVAAYRDLETFKSEMRQKTLDWINDQVAKCNCIIGNHVYRSVLLERLVEQREFERLDEFMPIESDEIIEALQHAQMIDLQNAPFSSIY